MTFALSILGLIALWIVLGSVVVANSSGAPWVPSARKEVERVLALAKLKPGEKFHDLGCGDGRLVFAAAKQGANAYGIELSLPNYLWCLAAKVLRRSQAHFLFGNLLKIDLQDVDVVHVYLLPEIYPKLEEKFQHELKPGSRVIVQAWPLPSFGNPTVDAVEKRSKIFVYQTKGV